MAEATIFMQNDHIVPLLAELKLQYKSDLKIKE